MVTCRSVQSLPPSPQPPPPASPALHPAGWCRPAAACSSGRRSSRSSVGVGEVHSCDQLLNMVGEGHGLPSRRAAQPVPAHMPQQTLGSMPHAQRNLRNQLTCPSARLVVAADSEVAPAPRSGGGIASPGGCTSNTALTRGPTSSDSMLVSTWGGGGGGRRGSVRAMGRQQRERRRRQGGAAAVACARSHQLPQLQVAGHGCEGPQARLANRSPPAGRPGRPGRSTKHLITYAQRDQMFGSRREFLGLHAPRWRRQRRRQWPGCTQQACLIA